MRIQFAAAIAVVTIGIAASAPLDAWAAADRTASAKRAVVAHAVRAQPQPATPPIGYCMQCLPPPYEWPHGGAGP